MEVTIVPFDVRNVAIVIARTRILVNSIQKHRGSFARHPVLSSEYWHSSEMTKQFQFLNGKPISPYETDCINHMYYNTVFIKKFWHPVCTKCQMLVVYPVPNARVKGTREKG